jgi:tetratricopeptide (TPR) repeat protein
MSRRSTTLLGVAGLLVLTLIAYFPVMAAGGFIWDDDSYVTENELLRDAGGLDGLARIWVPEIRAPAPAAPDAADADAGEEGEHPREYRVLGRRIVIATPQYYPVVFTSFWIEYHLWGLDPRGYHVVNVVLHALNAMLVWLLVRRLGVPGAWLVAAVFALHPVHVESVAWITERKNVLSGLLYLAAAASFLEFDDRLHGTGRERSRGEAWGWYGAALLLFVGALLSKSVTCSLPAALVLVLLYRRRAITRARLAALAPMFVIGLLAALNTAALERTHVGATGADFDLGAVERLLVASRALLFYPGKILWPQPLLFIYPRWTPDAGDVVGWLALVVVLAIGAGAVALWLRGRRGPFVALAFYAGTVLPAIGFFNVYPPRFSFVADHFQYLASLGVIALVVGAAAPLVTRPAVRIGAAAGLLVALGALTWRQTLIYRDAETVWRHTLAGNPGSWMPSNNMASLLLRKYERAHAAGDEERALAYVAEARAHAEAAVAVRPRHHPALSNLSEALRLQGDYAGALELVRRAQAADPRGSDNWWQAGRLEDLLGRPEDAIASYRHALELQPRSRLVHYELAQLLLRLDRPDDALPHYRAVLELDPDDFVSLLTAARIENLRGEHEAANLLFRRAYEAATDPGDEVQAASDLARFLARCPDERFRDPDAAIAIAERYVEVTRRQVPGLLDVLAVVYHDAGRRDDALRTAQEALALARALGLEDLAKRIAARVEQYRITPPE